MYSIWGKDIPKENIGFLLLYIALGFFAIGAFVFLASFALRAWPLKYHVYFVAPLVFFGIFLFMENVILKKSLEFGESRFDNRASMLVRLRNTVVALNFVPVVNIVFWQYIEDHFWVMLLGVGCYVLVYWVTVRGALQARRASNH